ncbi:MAG: AmmeMemoRadiSam system protein B [Campylobacterales bacterium]|nr:AmmeMemoRadiSam system protein B [Campylobacterales bacterium]
MSIRKSAVSGQFYPEDAKEISSMFEYYNQILDTHLSDKTLFDKKPRAIIVPHAGYIYSAFTANIAFRLLENTNAKRIVVIGPSHRVFLKGTSVSDFDDYETPFGMIKIDKILVHELRDKFGLDFVPEAHREHSTEVQMPFVKTYDEEASVVELVYGDEDPARLAKVIEYLLNDPQTVVVISTDLSHYHDIKKAKKLDNICLNAIKKLDTDMLHQGCEACGKIGIEAMLIAAKAKKLKPIMLDYRTSADASKDESQVVGYMSAAFL